MESFTSVDGTEIYVRSWSPERGEPVGVVQIAHGMGEHSARYSHVAETLAAAGYIVYAQDHRGHGRSIVGAPGELGENGWNLLVEDTVSLTERIRAQHPGLPVVPFGHSLGSFAVQQYLLDHSDLVDRVVLSGTTAADGLFDLIAGAGGDLLELFNRRFQPTRTEADWLSRDEAQVDAYLRDRLCGFEIDAANMGLLASTAFERFVDVTSVRADLPVLVMVGDQDPLNDGLALTTVLVDRYRGAGLTDVTEKVYAGARHEILNELNRDEVEADLLAWITAPAAVPATAG